MRKLCRTGRTGQNRPEQGAVEWRLIDESEFLNQIDTVAESWRCTVSEGTFGNKGVRLARDSRSSIDDACVECCNDCLDGNRPTVDNVDVDKIK